MQKKPFQMIIRQPVQNSLKRAGIDFEDYINPIGKTFWQVEARNRFTGEVCIVSPLIADCIAWVYQTSDEYEKGISKVKLSDFDRIRYFILEADQNAYYTCID